ncbi:MAG TPA: Gfo/Idh/MocA family oxidoreductase [Longimicrobiales bacterium]
MTTRRDFIKTSAALSATGSLLTGLDSHELNARPLAPVADRVLPRAGEPVRIGIIGTGGMGTEHCRAFMRLLNAGKVDMQIVALADVCDPRMQDAYKAVTEKPAPPKPVADAAASTVAEKAADPIVMTDVKMYRHYRALLDDKSIHGVLIATPEHWHGRIAEEALAAGKAVYLEKPMTRNLHDAMRLRKAVHSNASALLLVGTQYVTYASYQEAARLIADGTVGKPTFSQTSYCRNSTEGEWLYYKIDPAWQPGVNLDWNMWCGPLGKQTWNPEVYARWRRYRLYSTGIIGDLLVHYMTPLIKTLNVGWPTRVVASGGHYVDKKMENHDQVNINVEFEGEHTMIVAGSTCNEVGLETMIRAHKANLYLTPRKMTMRPERIFAEQLEEKTYDGPDVGDSQDQLRIHWIDCIRGNAQPLSDVDLGTRVMVIVDLATRSLWDGRAYRFDPQRLKAHDI